VRVLHLTRDYPPASLGGISTAVGGMTAALQRRDVEVAVVSFDGWRPSRNSAAAAPHRTGDDRAVFRVASGSELAAATAFARALSPQLLHVHHATLWPFAAALRAELRAPAIKSVHVLQIVQNRLRKLCEPTRSQTEQELALQQADRILAPSRRCLSDLAEHYPDTKARLRLAPLAVDDSDQARAAASAPRREPIVLTAGRFDPVKGTDLLFEALPAVLEAMPAARWVIAGGIPANRRSERRWLAQWQTRLPAHLLARLELTGWLDVAELGALYQRAMVLVVPSRYETFGLTPLEGMLHGLAVVAADAGALPELFEDDASGRHFPCGDARACADAVLALLRQPQTAMRLGRDAAARARSAYLWDGRIEAVLAVYRELCGAR